MIKKIEHIGVAVKNIENSVHIFRDLLGIPLEKVYESDAIKTKIAFFPARDSTIELIEPMDPSSPAAKFIEKRGEGIHHLCLGSRTSRRRSASSRQRGSNFSTRRRARRRTGGSSHS